MKRREFRVSGKADKINVKYENNYETQGVSQWVGHLELLQGRFDAIIVEQTFRRRQSFDVLLEVTK